MVAPLSRKVGKFEIRKKLGRGGMSDVYLALDTGTGQSVALKLIEEASDRDTRESIAAERLGAELQRRLAGVEPRVAEIFGAGDADGFFYVAMEYIEGHDLAEELQTGPLAPRKAADIAIAVAGALEAAHTLHAVIDGKMIDGIVHGDIKPKNIRIDARGQVRVLDFGIAKALSLSRRLSLNEFGSVPYSSPERLREGAVNVQSDLWSLAVTLYEMVTGLRPYMADTTERLEHMIRSNIPALPAPEPCPEPLRYILTKAMTPDPAMRYQSARQFAHDLILFRDGRAVSAMTGDFESTRRTFGRPAPDGTRRTDPDHISRAELSPLAIEDLRATRMAETVTLTGTWPTGATEALVSWRRDSFPKTPDDAADGRRVFTRSEYDLRNGFLRINGVAHGRHYFTVFVRASGAGPYAASRVVESVEIRYRIVTRKDLRRRTITQAWIDLQASEDVERLPGVRAVMAGAVPMRPDDGRVVASIAELAFVERSARIDLPPAGLDGFVKLFFTDDRHSREYRLIANPDELRVK
jgi:serine/threonine protein kinase